MFFVISIPFWIFIAIIIGCCIESSKENTRQVAELNKSQKMTINNLSCPWKDFFKELTILKYINTNIIKIYGIPKVKECRRNDIKYINLILAPCNRVGDIIYGAGTMNVRMVGPFKDSVNTLKTEKGGFYIPETWKKNANCIEEIRIIKIRVELTDERIVEKSNYTLLKEIGKSNFNTECKN